MQVLGMFHQPLLLEERGHGRSSIVGIFILAVVVVVVAAAGGIVSLFCEWRCRWFIVFFGEWRWWWQRDHTFHLLLLPQLTAVTQFGPLIVPILLSKNG